MNVQQGLYAQCVRWQRSSTASKHSPNFLALLRELEAHAHLRYSDYGPFSAADQPFLSRLDAWISQLSKTSDKQAMLQLVRWIIYLDRREMESLYRDVFRRVIVPWLTLSDFSFEARLAPDYDQRLLERVQKFDFYSITESFQHKTFENINSLSGLRKPVVLGEKLRFVGDRVEASKQSAGVVILEDFVGSGRQAARVLKKVATTLGSGSRILFAPLVALEQARRKNSALAKLNGVDIQPATVIPSRLCLSQVPHRDEPLLFKNVRTIASATRARVLERMSASDDPPDNPFGFEGAGALLVTHQNTPNNTLPLIHHKAPDWTPLFRRVHHSFPSATP
jgi:hypothetical protein